MLAADCNKQIKHPIFQVESVINFLSLPNLQSKVFNEVIHTHFSVIKDS